MAREVDARYALDADVASAGTLDTAFYTDAVTCSLARERVYRGGRYWALHERGVHHFHRLLCAALAQR